MTDELKYSGIACGIFAFSAYWLYRNKKRYLTLLENVTEYSVNDALLQKVNSDGVLEFVAVTGSVTANQNVITGSFNKNVSGVIQKITRREHFSKWHDKNEKWYDDSRLVSYNVNTEPFSLTGNDGLMRIRVENPSYADLDLNVVYNHYEPISTSSMDKYISSVLTGQHVKGIETVEKFLLSATKLTVLGKVITDSEGQLVICTPNIPDSQYVLTRDSLRTLINDVQSSATAIKIVTWLFFGAGCALLTYWFYCVYARNYFQHLRFNYEGSDGEIYTETDDVCVICLHRQRDVVILECGHVCSCRQCAELMSKCPICRGAIRKLVPIYHN